MTNEIKEKDILQLVRVTFVTQLLLEELDGLADNVVFKAGLKHQTNKLKTLLEKKLKDILNNVYDADENTVNVFMSEMDKNLDLVVERLMNQVNNA